MRTEELNYFLPKELIAQEPLEPRHFSRLLVVDRQREKFEHTTFLNLARYLEKRDLLVVNETRVIPARLKGFKEKGGGKIEILLLSELSPGKWQALVKPAKRLPAGTKIIVGEGRLKGLIEEKLGRGQTVISFDSDNPAVKKVLKERGEVPLPPYIKKPLLEKERYQTVFGKEEGSVAAPTAGLHFTKELLKKVQEKGVGLAKVNLRISLDTFIPITAGELKAHQIQGEFFEIDGATAKLVNQTIETGGKVIAVGTSSVRVLETAAVKMINGQWPKVKAKEGWTELFIYPGYKFKIISALITNFHGPKSTPLALVAAFAGKDLLMRVYQEAISKNYRFLSFGDAMLIL